MINFSGFKQKRQAFRTLICSRALQTRVASFSWTATSNLSIKDKITFVIYSYFLNLFIVRFSYYKIICILLILLKQNFKCIIRLTFSLEFHAIYY